MADFNLLTSSALRFVTSGKTPSDVNNLRFAKEKPPAGASSYKMPQILAFQQYQILKGQYVLLATTGLLNA